MTWCNIFSLSREAVDSILEKYPESAAKIHFRASEGFNKIIRALRRVRMGTRARAIVEQSQSAAPSEVKEEGGESSAGVSAVGGGGGDDGELARRGSGGEEDFAYLRNNLRVELPPGRDDEGAKEGGGLKSTQSWREKLGDKLGVLWGSRGNGAAVAPEEPAERRVSFESGGRPGTPQQGGGRVGSSRKAFELPVIAARRASETPPPPSPSVGGGASISRATLEEDTEDDFGDAPPPPPAAIPQSSTMLANRVRANARKASRLAEEEEEGSGVPEVRVESPMARPESKRFDTKRTSMSRFNSTVATLRQGSMVKIPGAGLHKMGSMVSFGVDQVEKDAKGPVTVADLYNVLMGIQSSQNRQVAEIKDLKEQMRRMNVDSYT
jgi:hypothetical protein